MPTNTREIGFEEFIEQHLTSTHGYRSRLASQYDRQYCLDRALLVEFIQATQPEEWKQYEVRFGSDAEAHLVIRLDEEIRDRGLLDVLRSGVTDYGAHFFVACYQPETGLNEETARLYEANILSVTRQVHYSERDTDKSLDMVIFVNGIPIATCELKNQLTGQSIKHGIRQYQTDRDPREPLLRFQRCLVHFAVDTDLVYLTTHLEGLRTRFLPFNRGDHLSAGNPVNPDGYKTAYLWEQIWSRESWLEIIGRFMHLTREQVEDGTGKTQEVQTLIFPRYHQLDTVRRLIEDSRTQGAGHNYLIQHSAGSGKSNTIAWTAHRLSELHTVEDQKVFGSVIVVTDRRVLDRQLREIVDSFSQVRGVVMQISEGSAQLRQALEQGEKIITTTLQKFPHIVESVGALPGKRFAVIIDEAHSSQSGESSRSLKEVLSATSLDEAAQMDDTSREPTLEDMILKQIRSRRAEIQNISFFAFTATPKQKTMEIFGTKSPLDGKFYPFSLYSMKQAIEEKFILDVLKNYTTYQVFFSLLKKVENDPDYQKSKAQMLLLSYVERHEHAISKKVEVMVEHFSHQIASRINGRAKAMIVTKSRLHAVRYKQAMDAYCREHGVPFRTLVAFSGTVRDGGREYAEASMNGVPEKNTAEEFKKDEYRFLIVAEKFQTGFDQPLLSVMYVDKKLGGVHAVQTLSRLNRTCRDKEEVFVLDFVNDTDAIEDAFQPYYTTTILSRATDPNLLHDLERDILHFKLFYLSEVEEFVMRYFRGAPAAKLHSLLDPVVNRYEELLPEEKADVRIKITDYVRKYAFIAQIIDFQSTDLEKLYQFLRFLLRKLPVDRERLPIEVLESVDMESYKLTKSGETEIVLTPGGSELDPISGDGRGGQDVEIDALSQIIQDINEKFGTSFSEGDRVILNNLSRRLMQNKSLEGSIQNNARNAAKIKFDQVFDEELVGMVNQHFDLYKKLDTSLELKAYVNQRIFDHIRRQIGEKF